MSHKPTWGIAEGQEVHAHTRHYQGRLLTPAQALKGVEGFNAKLAVLITTSVGTMACAYAFCLIALVSLPATLVKAGVVSSSAFPHFLVGEGLIGLVSWAAQTFIQLVLLAVIMVGQRVQATANDARTAKQFDDTELILDAVKQLLQRTTTIETRMAIHGVAHGEPEPERGPPFSG